MSDDIQPSSGGVMVLLEKKIQVATGFPNMLLILKTVRDFADRIPDSVSAIQGATAHELAAKFLKGQALCADLVAIAEQYEAKTARSKKAAYSAAFFEAMPKYKTQKERECYAEMHETFIKACDEHDEAVMFKTLIENKREDLVKAHYFMRRIAENDNYDPGADGGGSNKFGDMNSRGGRTAF